MSSSSSSIICKLAPGGGGLVESIEFLHFLELFLGTIFLSGILVLWWYGFNLSKCITCRFLLLFVSWMRYTLSEILLITLKGPVQGQCNFLDFPLGTTGLCK